MNKRRHATLGLALTKSTYTYIKLNAIDRKIQFNLTFEELDTWIFNQYTTNPHCHYCGVKLVTPVEVYWMDNPEFYGKTKGYKDKNGCVRQRVNRTQIIHPLKVSLDRKNSSLDYTFDNLVLSCKKCNTIKMQYPEDEFLLHCQKIVDYQNSKKSNFVKPL